MTNITVSLETAEKMNRKGYVEKTVFNRAFGGDKCETERTLFCSDDDSYSAHSLYSAPTAQEILDELKESEGSRITVWREPLKGKCFFCAGYLDLDGIPMSPVYSGDVMVEAIAKLRIRCKENGHLSS